MPAESRINRLLAEQAYPRRMGIEVLPATGRWDDFASFMVPRKPGGRGRVCIAYRNSSLDMPRPPASVAASPAGSSAASFPDGRGRLLDPIACAGGGDFAPGAGSIYMGPSASLASARESLR
jgi:hypothetical protein